ncbi:UNVERIFIED_CONTAM: hypothetical protein Sangu_2959900 [Sesamum angustifolium]|uniref:Uncharacterized protein n=1 Tax=Sesamum angustifolium TaxID=2727405 RepID=A0AAW2IJY9_9LAMI
MVRNAVVGSVPLRLIQRDCKLRRRGWWFRRRFLYIYQRSSPATSYKNLSMKLLGLRAPWTVWKLRELVRLHDPALVYLSETKCSVQRAEVVKKILNYFGLGIPSRGRSRDLLMLLRKDLDVLIQSFSNNHIDATVQASPTAARWRFIGFYGHPDVPQRRATWCLLRQLSRQSHRPWLCMGNFNEILCQEEKQGVNVRVSWQISAFRECLSDCNLHDLGCQGS